MLILLAKFLTSLPFEKKEEPFINLLRDADAGYSFKMRFGPKKIVCEDSVCIMERFSDECYFSSIYDGH